MFHDSNSGPKPMGIGESRLAEFCRSALGEDFVVTRIEMLRHFPYVENGACRRYHELLAKKNANTTRLTEEETNELAKLGQRLQTKTLDETLLTTKRLSTAYSNAIDVILRGGITIFDHGGSSSKRVQETAHALLEKAMDPDRGRPEVRHIDLPQSDKSLDFGDSNTNNAAKFTKAWKETVVPLRGKARHVLLISNRSYAHLFATATEQPEAGLQAQESAFEKLGGFWADYGERGGRDPGSRLVKDKISVRTRSDVEAFVQVPAFLGMVQEHFPEALATALANMDVVDFQNLANAVIRGDAQGALSLAGCGVPELDLAALRAATGTRPFESGEPDLLAAKEALLSLGKDPESLSRAAPVLARAYGNDVAGRLAAVLAEDGKHVSESAWKEAGALAGGENGATLERFAGLLTDARETCVQARQSLGRAMDVRISGKDAPDQKSWPLGGKWRPGFVIVGADGNAVFDSSSAPSSEERNRGLLAALAAEPGVTVLEAEGGSGKSLALAEAARAWIMNGCRISSTGKVARARYVRLAGTKVGDNGRIREIEDVHAGHDVLLVDALDEAVWGGENGLREQREKFARRLEEITRGGTRIVLTSRPGHYVGTGARRLRAAGFDLDRADAFVREFFSGSVGASAPAGWTEFRKRAETNAALRLAVENPLSLTLLCEVVMAGTENDPNGGFQRYAKNPAELFERAAALRLERWEYAKGRTSKTGLPVGKREDAQRAEAIRERVATLMGGLGQLAYLMGEGYRITEENAQDFLPAACRDLLDPIDRASAKPTTLDLGPLGLLVQRGSDGTVVFAHEKMREYFAVRHILGISKRWRGMPKWLLVEALENACQAGLVELALDAIWGTGLEGNELSTVLETACKHGAVDRALEIANWNGLDLTLIAEGIRAARPKEWAREESRWCETASKVFAEQVLEEARETGAWGEILARALKTVCENGLAERALEAAREAGLGGYNLAAVLAKACGAGLTERAFEMATEKGVRGYGLTMVLRAGCENGLAERALKMAKAAGLTGENLAMLLEAACQAGLAERALRMATEEELQGEGLAMVLWAAQKSGATIDPAGMADHNGKMVPWVSIVINGGCPDGEQGNGAGSQGVIFNVADHLSLAEWLVGMWSLEQGVFLRYRPARETSLDDRWQWLLDTLATLNLPNHAERRRLTDFLRSLPV